jgi:hypothetical protein
MIKKIITVDKSAAGRSYGTDLKGEPMFPRTDSIVLVAGQYANVVETTQTQTYAEDGETLVDLAVPVKRNIVTAVFANRNEAIAAQAEEHLFENEAKLFAAAETVRLRETYKLEGVDLSKLTA